MPHDFQGEPLKKGDVVSILFLVNEVHGEGNDGGCNVNLVAVDQFIGTNLYKPVITCNSLLTLKSKGSLE